MHIKINMSWTLNGFLTAFSITQDVMNILLVTNSNKLCYFFAELVILTTNFLLNYIYMF